MRPDTAIFSHARLQSTRVPNKMIRPFGGTTSLVSIMARKLAILQAHGWHVFFAGGDAAIEHAVRQHHIPWVERSRASLTEQESTARVFDYLAQIETPHLLFVNACLPFLTVDTIEAFAQRDPPCFGVIEHHNHFVDLCVGSPFVPPGFSPINFSPHLDHIDTRTVRPLYSFAHALYLFERDYFLRHGFFWSWHDVHLVPLPGGIETMDIDTQDDFTVASVLWKHLQKEQRCPI